MIDKNDIEEVRFRTEEVVSAIVNLIGSLEHIGFDNGGKVRNEEAIKLSNDVDSYFLNMLFDVESFLKKNEKK